MYHNTLSDYKSALAACRFCPMCKPAADVAMVTCMESHSTRSRAILLWRWVEAIAEPAPRDLELLYQNTLESISESWCVSHYPVSGYMLAARRRAVTEGLIPAAVRSALERNHADEIFGEGNVLFVAGEIWELANRGEWITTARKALKHAGIDATTIVAGNGVIDFALGDNSRARARGETIARIIAERQPEKIIVDGPDTLFAFTRLWPNLGISLPKIPIVSLTEILSNDTKLNKQSGLAGGKAFCHEARSAFFLAEKLADDGALRPEFAGPLEVLGSGAVYESLHKLAMSTVGSTVLGTWMRTLAKSCGSDDGLWLTYPRLADKLGVERLNYAMRLKSSVILTDSPLAAAHLQRIASKVAGAPVIYWSAQLAV